MTEQQLPAFISIEETQKVEAVLEKFASAASVEAVYGKPVKQGDTIVVPAAEVMSFMGFGVGSGSGTDPQTQAGGGGGGGGGGGRVLARPAAVIIIQEGNVRVEPVVDVTKIALGFFTAVGFVAGMMYRMSRSRLRM